MREEQGTSTVGLWPAPGCILREQRQNVVRDLTSGALYEETMYPIPGCDGGYDFDVSQLGIGHARMFCVSDHLYVAATHQEMITPLQLHIFGDGLVTIRVMLAGRTRFHGDKFDPIEMQAPLVTVFNHRHNDELLHEIGGGMQRVVTLIACPDYLRREVGWSFDNDNSAPMLLGLTPTVEKLARDMVESTFTGARLGTFIRARALELLCTLATEWDEHMARDPDEAQRLTTRDRERIHMVREQLKTMAHHPPSMSQLSRQAGMNKTKLMRGFKQAYGETIADYCRRLRMEEAKAMLLAERLTIGEIAVAVGYQHQSSFTAAFSAFFGFPPKTLLRATTIRALHGVSRGLN